MANEKWLGVLKAKVDKGGTLANPKDWKLAQDEPFTNGTMPIVAQDGARYTQVCIVGPGPADEVMATARLIVEAVKAWGIS